MTEQYLPQSINTPPGPGSLNFLDDFIGGDGVGNTNWTTAVAGTGVITPGKWAGTDGEKHPGNLALVVAAAAGEASIVQVVGWSPQGTQLETWVGFDGINDPGTDEVSFSFGFNLLTASDAMVFFYDPSSPNWQAITRIGGSNVSVIDTGVPVESMAQGNKLTIVANELANDGVGNVQYFIDGVLVGDVDQTPVGTSVTFALKLERTFASANPAGVSVDIVTAVQAIER